MDSVGGIIMVVLVAIGLLAGAGIVHYSISNTGDQATYTDSFDPGTNRTLITLNQSNRGGVYYSSTVNVTDENGTLMRPTVDYNWHPNNGTLHVLDNGGLDGDATATIDYSLRVPSSQQQTYATLFGDLINFAYALPLLLGVAGVVAAISVFTRFS